MQHFILTVVELSKLKPHRNDQRKRIIEKVKKKKLPINSKFRKFEDTFHQNIEPNHQNRVREIQNDFH